MSDTSTTAEDSVSWAAGYTLNPTLRGRDLATHQEDASGRVRALTLDFLGLGPF